MSPEPSESVSMRWLICDGKVLASVEVPVAYKAKLKGLIGRSYLDGAFLLKGVQSVHTFGMKFDLDVAFLNADMKIVKVVALKPYRFSWPSLKAKYALEAEAGAFAQWGIGTGDILEISE